MCEGCVKVFEVYQLIDFFGFFGSVKGVKGIFARMRVRTGELKNFLFLARV